MRKFLIPSLMAIALTGASSMAIAQTTTTSETPTTTAKPVAPATTAGKTAPAVVMIKEADAKGWINKRVYSETGSDIGEISGYNVAADGNVEFFTTDIGGFLGLGETIVQVKPAQFEMRDDKLYLNMTKEEALKLPRAIKK